MYLIVEEKSRKKYPDSSSNRQIIDVSRTKLNPISLLTGKSIGTCKGDTIIYATRDHLGEFVSRGIYCKWGEIKRFNPSVQAYEFTDDFHQFEMERTTALETYETLCGDPGDVELTAEGTKAFFELLKQPDPARERILKESIGISSKEQRSRFGKERVYVNFQVKE